MVSGVGSPSAVKASLAGAPVHLLSGCCPVDRGTFRHLQSVLAQCQTSVEGIYWPLISCLSWV